MLVGSCSVLSSIGFRDFFTVAPAFYEFMVIELKKSWQKAMAEVKPLTFLPTLPLPFFPQNPVVILNSHTILKSLMHILSLELCIVLYHLLGTHTPGRDWRSLLFISQPLLLLKRCSLGSEMIE